MRETNGTRLKCQLECKDMVVAVKGDEETYAYVKELWQGLRTTQGRCDYEMWRVFIPAMLGLTLCLLNHAEIKYFKPSLQTFLSRDSQENVFQRRHLDDLKCHELFLYIFKR